MASRERAILQRRILNELRRVEAECQPFPTTRQLADLCGAALSSVHAACDQLRDGGFIDNHAGWGLARKPRERV